MVECPECGSDYVEWYGDETTKCQDCGNVAPDEDFDVDTTKDEYL